MNLRRRNQSPLASPVLIGALTVLAVIVAVFLAYNANQGLPFVPTYNLDAELPSAANLVRGNVVCRTVSPGLNVWGTRAGVGLNTVERNVVAETGSPGIEVHGRARLGRNQVLGSAREPRARACDAGIPSAR